MAKFQFSKFEFEQDRHFYYWPPTKNITNVPSFNIDATTIFPSATVRNVGITPDPSLTLDVYSNKLSKVAFLQLCRIAQLRSYVSPKMQNH